MDKLTQQAENIFTFGIFDLYVLKGAKVSIIYREESKKGRAHYRICKVFYSSDQTLPFSFFWLLGLIWYVHYRICKVFYSSDPFFFFWLLGLIWYVQYSYLICTVFYRICKVFYSLDHIPLFSFLWLLGLIWYVQGSTEVDGRRLNGSGAEAKNKDKNQNNPALIVCF